MSRRFAGRQVLSGGGAVSLPAGLRARASLSGSWGLPMTPLPVTESTFGTDGGIPTTGGGGTDPGSTDRTVRERASAYVRLDARIERAFTADLLGGRVGLTPYAELINALDRENSLFHRVPAEGGGLQPVNPVPMLPVVGVSFRAPAAPPSGRR